MSFEATVETLEEQQLVVQRYARQIKEIATGGNREIRADGRRCYELLNECAMELSRLSRQLRPSKVRPD